MRLEAIEDWEVSLDGAPSVDVSQNRPAESRSAISDVICHWRLRAVLIPAMAFLVRADGSGVKLDPSSSMTKASDGDGIIGMVESGTRHFSTSCATEEHGRDQPAHSWELVSRWGTSWRAESQPGAVVSQSHLALDSDASMTNR